MATNMSWDTFFKAGGTLVSSVLLGGAIGSEIAEMRGTIVGSCVGAIIAVTFSYCDARDAN